jgi:hypothetical protein
MGSYCGRRPAAKDIEMNLITWRDLEVSKRLHDGDVVSVRFDDIADGAVELALELAPHKTWWKGVQLLDSTNGQVGFVEVQDGTKSAGPISAAAVDIETGGHIVLWKAKTFGVHTPMYELAGIERIRGKRVTFHWSVD